MQTIGMSITNPDYPDDVHLLDPEEFEASEEFKNTHIRPRIVQDWYANDSFLINEFVQFCEKFRPSAEVVDQWQSLLQAQLDANEKESLKSAVSYKNRVGRIIRDFHEAVEYAAWRKEQKQAKRAASVSAYESKKKGKIHKQIMCCILFYHFLISVKKRFVFFNLFVGIVSPHQQGAADADVVTDAKSAPTDKRRTPREIKHRSLLPDSFHSELVSTCLLVSYCLFCYPLQKTHIFLLSFVLVNGQSMTTFCGPVYTFIVCLISTSTMFAADSVQRVPR